MLLFRLALASFAIQAGFHGFTASLPLFMTRSGVPDAEIGLVMGAAALVQLPAAFIVGGLVDRFGGGRLYFVGAGMYALGALLLAWPGLDPTRDRWLLLAIRAIQGVGIATCLPSALAMVPALVPEARRGFGLSFIGSAQNLTLVILPPLSIAVLDASGAIQAVALMTIAFVAAGAALTIEPARVALGAAARALGEGVRKPRRGYRIAWRREWLSILAVVLLYVTHWGAVTAFLPARAEAAGANVGLFFAADGVAILLLRVPTGAAADRVASRWLVLAGLGITIAALALLLVEPTTPLLIVSGALGGAGGGLVLTAALVEISRRSDERDRGSAFSLLSGAIAGAIALGSLGGAAVVAVAGFEATMLAGIGGVVLAGVVAVLDAGLGKNPRARAVGREAA
ncbi:MAG TPA: MFS transporter [Candidatus Limnocylindrales bacterium]|nr:MFS transporter [Candidatus Limnocylindrales bacterium]